MTSEGNERNPAVDPQRDGGLGSEVGAPKAKASTAPERNEVVTRQGTDFDPTPFVRQLRGRGGETDYLDVKWRLLWLRKEHPDAEIVTELVEHDPQMAIFKATVAIPTGGKATGYGSETASDFPDFIEKAETKAIGRALNALGYGAQFGDFQRPEESALERVPAPSSDDRPAPSGPPVALPRREEAPRKLPETRMERRSATPPTTPSQPPTAVGAELVDYSWSAFWPWARERGLNGPKEIENLIGQQIAGLSPAQLRELILAADARR